MSGVEEIKPLMTAVASKVSEAENTNVNIQLLGHSTNIQRLGAAPLDDLLASDQVLGAFALWIGECTGLLGATLEVITLDSAGNTDPSAECDQQGAAAVVAAEEPL